MNCRLQLSINKYRTMMSDFQEIFVPYLTQAGFPVWWYDIPMPMYTFLDSYDFTGKTIIPFLSHEGSSNGGSAEQTINEHARGAAVRFEDALSIRGGKVDSAEQDVRDWVDGLGFGK